jgi:hypothetical protein
MITWKILAISGNGKKITQAKYFVTLKYEDKMVETEGNWYFEIAGDIPFKNVTEIMVIDWIKGAASKDGENIIEKRLQEQMDTLLKQDTVVAPWLPQVFTPRI